MNRYRGNVKTITQQHFVILLRSWSLFISIIFQNSRFINCMQKPLGPGAGSELCCRRCFPMLGGALGQCCTHWYSAAAWLSFPQQARGGGAYVPRLGRDTWVTSGAASPGGHAAELLWPLRESASWVCSPSPDIFILRSDCQFCRNRLKVWDLVIMFSSNAPRLWCLLTKLLHKNFSVI